jgi:hypothetical protein
MMERETCGRSCTPSTQNTGAYIICHYYWNFLASIYLLCKLFWSSLALREREISSAGETPQLSSASVVGVSCAALRGFEPCYIPVLWTACRERRRRVTFASLRISLSTLLSLCCYLSCIFSFINKVSLFPLSLATPGFI